MTNYTKYTHLNRRDFLGVPGAGDGFVLVIFETDVPQLMIWHVLNVDPAHIELALPFWITPNAYRWRIWNWDENKANAFKSRARLTL